MSPYNVGDVVEMGDLEMGEPSDPCTIIEVHPPPPKRHLAGYGYVIIDQWGQVGHTLGGMMFGRVA